MSARVELLKWEERVVLMAEELYVLHEEELLKAQPDRHLYASFGILSERDKAPFLAMAEHAMKRGAEPGEPCTHEDCEDGVDGHGRGRDRRPPVRLVRPVPARAAERAGRVLGARIVLGAHRGGGRALPAAELRGAIPYAPPPEQAELLASCPLLRAMVDTFAPADKVIGALAERVVALEGSETKMREQLDSLSSAAPWPNLMGSVSERARAESRQERPFRTHVAERVLIAWRNLVSAIGEASDTDHAYFAALVPADHEAPIGLVSRDKAQEFHGDPAEFVDAALRARGVPTVEQLVRDRVQAELRRVTVDALQKPLADALTWFAAEVKTLNDDQAEALFKAGPKLAQQAAAVAVHTLSGPHLSDVNELAGRFPELSGVRVQMQTSKEALVVAAGKARTAVRALQDLCVRESWPGWATDLRQAARDTERVASLVSSLDDERSAAPAKAIAEDGELLDRIMQILRSGETEFWSIVACVEQGWKALHRVPGHDTIRAALGVLVARGIVQREERQADCHKAREADALVVHYVLVDKPGGA